MYVCWGEEWHVATWLTRDFHVLYTWGTRCEHVPRQVLIGIWGEQYGISEIARLLAEALRIASF